MEDLRGNEVSRSIPTSLQNLTEEQRILLRQLKRTMIEKNDLEFAFEELEKLDRRFQHVYLDNINEWIYCQVGQ
ncbi:Oidioi.mRNA.OKI2018_I69.PAR.g9994.t1.cds [Oikopleura dioica]|uniref:Oidioi.mRNA.OKI2018_I69.PAR.g9994.t1.cds n=1 Tax=Oikopleura dioica TaxID=34765 RepID=A0ABN7RRX6_OIKDI|nr:Oidioi.mRNA.OKI2018_I69.PAR.g9994.t1.cds [Oikopleura dioica]